VLEFTEPIRPASARAVKHFAPGRNLQAELGGTASPSSPRLLVFAALKAPVTHGNSLIQKKKKRDE
jgi:hypothetical protein